MTEQQITAASERVVNTIEQCMREIALAAAVLRAVPDATPERVEALLRVGLAVERLEGTGDWFELERTGLDYYLHCGGGIGGAGATIPEAVAAALGDVP